VVEPTTIRPVVEQRGSMVDWNSQPLRPLRLDWLVRESARRFECRDQALECIVARLQIMRISSFGRHRVNHRLVEQAPGDGRLCPRPLARANRIAFKANRSGFKTRSNGQDEHAGLALLDGDGPASHARHHGRPGTSVQSKDRIKHRTAGNHRANNIQHWKRQQGRQEDNEGNSEGNSLRNARTKETKKALEVALT